MQAGVFSTYGQLYQSVSAQAQAIHQQFVQLLNQSSGSYQETEAANQAGAAANSLSNATSGASSAAGTAATDPIDSLADFINGVSSALSGSFFGSNIGNLTNVQVGNWASAGSDLIGLGGGGLLTALAGPATAGSDIGGLGSALAGNVAPAAGIGGMGGAGAMGAAPVLAAAGQGSSIGALSVPPTWAGGAGIPAASTPVTLASQSWASSAAGNWWHVERDRGHARGRQRRSRRFELRRPALRRQAKGHAGGAQADAHLITLAANVGRLNHQSSSYTYE